MRFVVGGSSVVVFMGVTTVLSGSVLGVADAEILCYYSYL